MQMKPCPFCGEKSKLGVVTKWLRQDGIGAKRGAYARCKRCHARGSLVSLDESYDIRNEMPSKSRAESLVERAVEKWNSIGSAAPNDADGLPLFAEPTSEPAPSAVVVEVRQVYGVEYEIQMKEGMTVEDAKNDAVLQSTQDNTFTNFEHLLRTETEVVG